MPTEVTLSIDRTAIEGGFEEELRAWLQAQCSAVASEAFRRAPRSTPAPIHPMSDAPQRVPGTLAHSIDTEIEGSGTRLVGVIRANAPYARFVHEDTEAHAIFPRRPAFALAFWSEKKADFVVTGGVSHPGTTGQPFLRDALTAVMGG